MDFLTEVIKAFLTAQVLPLNSPTGFWYTHIYSLCIHHARRSVLTTDYNNAQWSFPSVPESQLPTPAYFLSDDRKP